MSSIESAMRRMREAQQNADTAERSQHYGRVASQAPSGGNHEECEPSGHPSDRYLGATSDCGGHTPHLRINLSKLQSAGMYPPPSMESRLNNEYRRIKRPLVNNATGSGAPLVPGGNIIVVTSSVQGEGKTFTALNLALSMARDPDFAVTLVDGDCARRDLSHVLEIRNQPGLLDLLADDRIASSNVVMTTDVDGLSILGAGANRVLSDELLSSQRMTRLVSELGGTNPNHVILFDAPPVLASPEAVTLAHHVGQIVMVVKASSTLRDQVVTALGQLGQNKAVNMVLNQSIGGAGGDRYGGYYGSGYGQGS